MEIRVIEDYEKYVFRNRHGWEWICKVVNGNIYFKIVSIKTNSGFIPNSDWTYWYQFSQDKLYSANNLIFRVRDETSDNYNPVYSKIKIMEKRFQERKKYA